jgi:cation diffusion facilitator family transporter
MVVTAITALTMVVEIVAGIVFGSMALLADGLHMGSHASALGISAFAYYYARRYAYDRRFSFGTGKANSLAAYTSAALLAVFALFMGWASVGRLLHPVAIDFNQAIFVAIAGLAVNLVSLAILGGGQAVGEHGHGHGDHERGSGQRHGHGHEHHDQNLLSAYLHVLADALTSILAIAALLSGKYLGWVWLDPVMGILGAILVIYWAAGLLRSSSAVLLDMQAPGRVRDAIVRSVEAGGDVRVCDLHVWSIGPGVRAAEVAVVARRPKAPSHYASRIPRGVGLEHVTVEVRPRAR